jgi:hypothetical protein
LFAPVVMIVQLASWSLPRRHTSQRLANANDSPSLRWIHIGVFDPSAFFRHSVGNVEYKSVDYSTVSNAPRRGRKPTFGPVLNLELGEDRTDFALWDEPEAFTRRLFEFVGGVQSSFAAKRCPSPRRPSYLYAKTVLSPVIRHVRGAIAGPPVMHAATLRVLPDHCAGGFVRTTLGGGPARLDADATDERIVELWLRNRPPTPA